jgi:hypothetical protein
MVNLQELVPFRTSVREFSSNIEENTEPKIIYTSNKVFNMGNGDDCYHPVDDTLWDFDTYQSSINPNPLISNILKDGTAHIEGEYTLTQAIIIMKEVYLDNPLMFWGIRLVDVNNSKISLNPLHPMIVHAIKTGQIDESFLTRKYKLYMFLVSTPKEYLNKRTTSLDDLQHNLNTILYELNRDYSYSSTESVKLSNSSNCDLVDSYDTTYLTTINKQNFTVNNKSVSNIHYLIPIQWITNGVSLPYYGINIYPLGNEAVQLTPHGSPNTAENPLNDICTGNADKYTIQGITTHNIANLTSALNGNCLSENYFEWKDVCCMYAFDTLSEVLNDLTGKVLDLKGASLEDYLHIWEKLKQLGYQVPRKIGGRFLRINTLKVTRIKEGTATLWWDENQMDFTTINPKADKKEITFNESSSHLHLVGRTIVFTDEATLKEFINSYNIPVDISTLGEWQHNKIYSCNLVSTENGSEIVYNIRQSARSTRSSNLIGLLYSLFSNWSIDLYSKEQQDIVNLNIPTLKVDMLDADNIKESVEAQIINIINNFPSGYRESYENKWYIHSVEGTRSVNLFYKDENPDNYTEKIYINVDSYGYLNFDYYSN